MSDVHDILELDRPNAVEISKASILGLRTSAVPVKKKEKEVMKRPEGMHRELFALLYSTDGNKELPPLLQTDSMPQQGYKRTKARLGMRRVRPWAWVQFCNPARKDGALLYHWRRVADQGKEYPFAQFDKHVEILQYSDSEYRDHLVSDTWSRQDTDTLMQLCQQFDLRWPLIHDRWPKTAPDNTWSEQRSDSSTFSIEDIKERYYHVSNTLKKDFFNTRESLNENDALEAATNDLLCALDNELAQYERTTQYFGLPQADHIGNNEIVHEENDPTVENYFQEHVNMLDEDQRAIFNRIRQKVDDDEAGFIFIDAPGGTRKTFFLNIVLSYVRQNRHLAIATASSGVAAILLKLGRTSHSHFNFPIPIKAISCKISPQDPTGRLLFDAHLIVWDEAPISHRHLLECLDRTIKDIMNNDILLPVVRRAQRPTLVKA
ncbi:DNA helicase Pif1-like [Trinorchestia longiramus]|nr:DNA helicase Pif1-like [Trinorchestia longiramus]